MVFNRLSKTLPLCLGVALLVPATSWSLGRHQTTTNASASLVQPAPLRTGPIASLRAVDSPFLDYRQNHASRQQDYALTPTGTHQPSPGAGISPLIATVPAAATTLLPNWLSSQSSVLELAQPMGRWLSLLNPIAPSPRLAARSTASSQRLPGEFTCIDTPEQSYDSFSAWIAGCLTREVGDEALAQALAERIESGFRGRDWSGQSVEPTLAENFPAARLGDRLLFIITDEVAEAAGINGEVLATRWLNQLRLVLGDQPLTLLDSQYAMHGLKPTGDNLRGDASWYGPYFHGRLTATGEIYNQDMFTAAHKELPFDTYLKITNLLTGDQLVVRINDRGPYVGDRMLDLSLGAATYLGAKDTGVVPIRAEVLEPADPLQVQLPDFDREQALQRPLITMRRP